MTVPTEQGKATYVGDGSEDTFPTQFLYMLSAHLKVTWTPIVTGIPQLLVQGIGYNAPDHQVVADDNVFMTFVPAVGDLIVIEHSVPFTQPISFRTQGEFSPATHEEALDAGAIRDQELLRRVKALESAGAPGSVVAGAGVSFTGSTLNVGQGSGVTVGADTVAVNFGVAGEMSAIARTAAYEGSLAKAARIDHRHDISVGTAVELTDSTNSTGLSVQLAASNHQHAHGNRGGGSLHALATGGTAGFMSAADKLKLDAMAGTSFGSIVAVTKAASSDGVSGNAARADHKHDITTAAPSAGAVQIGNVAAEGSATTLARADHVHTVTAAAPVDLSGSGGVRAGNIQGVAATFARSDHKHDHGQIENDISKPPVHNLAKFTNPGLIRSKLNDRIENLMWHGAVTTTNATPTTLLNVDVAPTTGEPWVGGSLWSDEQDLTKIQPSGSQFYSTNNWMVCFHGEVVGIATNGNGVSFGVAATFRKTSGSALVLQQLTKLWTHATGGAAAWDVTAVSNAGNGPISPSVMDLKVTGAAATTITWAASFRRIVAVTP